MKNKILIGALLMIFVLAFSSSSVWAGSLTLVTNTTTAQDAISGLGNNCAITFDPNGNYSNFSATLRANASNVALNGNGANLTGTGISGSHVLTIDGVNKITIRDFNINCAGQNGIRGNNTLAVTIINCTFTNGSAAINLFGASSGFNITGNTITNMKVGNGNGISVVHHGTNGLTGVSESYITNNKISNVNFGMFIGGNFKGYITGNNISSASQYGIQFVGRQAATNGVVNVTMTNNYINSTGIGLSLSSPTFTFLNLTNNIIQGNSKCVEIGSSPSVNFANLIGINNKFWGGEGDLGDLALIASPWLDNTWNGNPYY
jgi:hypothetical protein